MQTPHPVLEKHCSSRRRNQWEW